VIVVNEKIYLTSLLTRMIIKEIGEGERLAALASPPPARLSLSIRFRVRVALWKNHVTRFVTSN
jgi:hypothetical protein